MWWQGHKDSGNKAHASIYEENMVRIIHSLQKEFNAPNAKFIIATDDFDDMAMKGTMLQICNAQLYVSGDSGRYPEFQGKVRTVDTQKSWRASIPSGHHHYGLHAEAFMETGVANT